MSTTVEGPMTPQTVARIFAEKIPFNRELGFEFEFDDDGRPILHFQKKPEMVGNFVRGNLHGGVISSCLDVIGGFAAFCALLEKLDPAEGGADEVFGRMGTIDLRVDYLRAGYGRDFRATAYVLRVGRKVAVTRMELHNENSELIAVGTGAYIVG